MEIVYLIKKDLTIIISRGAGLAQALLLGLIMIFLFSLAKSPGEAISAQAASTMFWLSSLFCQILIFQMLYSMEKQSKFALILASSYIQQIVISKALTALIILLLSQIVFLPACIIFLGQSIAQNYFYAFLGLILVDIALIVCGSLLGALASGSDKARESLLSIIIFPLLIPPILAGISVFSALFTIDNVANLNSWLTIALAFDCFFLIAALLLFEFIYAYE